MKYFQLIGFCWVVVTIIEKLGDYFPRKSEQNESQRDCK